MRRIIDFILEHFFKFTRDREEEGIIKNDCRLQIRLNKKELELYKAFANFKKISVSKLIRDSANSYIDNFIIDNSSSK